MKGEEFSAKFLPLFFHQFNYNYCVVVADKFTIKYTVDLYLAQIISSYRILIG